MPGYRERFKSKLKRLLDRPASPQPGQHTTGPAMPKGTPDHSTDTFPNIQGGSQHTSRSLVPSAIGYATTAGDALKPPIVNNQGFTDGSAATARSGTEHIGWTGLRLFAAALDRSVDAFGPLKQAAEVLVSFIETFETMAENQKEYQELEVQLDTLFADISQYFTASTPPAMTSSMRNLEQAIKRETDLIKQKEQQIGTSRFRNAEHDAEEIMECYRRIQGLLQRLTLNANLDTWRTVDELLTESRLSRLPNSPAAYFRSADAASLRRGGCTKDTRVELLRQMHRWSCDIASQKIYWLNGMAGTGKTTVAYSLCELLEKDQALAASFFCSRQLPQCRNVNRIIPSIAYQLSRFSQPFRHAVSPVLESNPDVHNQSVLEQFKQLVVQPIDKVKAALPTNLVVVIDALDECEADTGLDDILSVILSYSHELPLRFFVTSRPDLNIINHMRSQQAERLRTEMRLHELEHPTVQKDIRTYLRAELEPHLELSASELNTLTERSGVLFIYAATVVRYIGANKFTKKKARLAQVLRESGSLSNESNTEIDRLYTRILQAAFTDSTVTGSDQVDMLRILHTAVCSREPLSVDVMAGLLGFDSAESVEAAVLPLLSVLQVSEHTKVITTLHESFPEYLLSAERSGELHCDAGNQNKYLARLCFDQISIPSPCFNICRLESSFVFDKDVPELEARVEEAISKELFYACRYWGIHLKLANNTQDLCSALLSFLSERLLLWMEIMSLKGCLSDGMKVMYEIEEWSQHLETRADSVEALIRDGWKFVAYCASNQLALSTPHIYVSALSFWPASSPISKHYAQGIPHLIRESSTAITVRKVTPLATINTQSELLCSAYSPSGLFMVTGSEGGIIRIWDPRTGQSVGQPLKGHTDRVRSVVYSPNGYHIVSGSDDETIQIWDAFTGHPAVEALKGHSGGIYAVAYSPSGEHIVSGSSDRTMRIWDACTGQPVGNPFSHDREINSVAYSDDGRHIVLGSDNHSITTWDVLAGRPLETLYEGHTGLVFSVGYSPKSKHLVSGSADDTLCIWDAETFRPVCKPLSGHTDPVLSVTYSPNGEYIVSGSRDRTVRVWDAFTGQPVGQPLTGHTNWVISVSYSPDGKYIASASEDGTIHIWDALIGPPEGQPLESHTSRVYSVAYSPDSKHIASGSDDKTVRIWDALTGQPVGQPLQGHSERVFCVAYSPDGKHIISGSGDCTIRIWDALTGQAIGQPLEEHTGSVLSVAYSPDGQRIASGSYDKTVHIWDALTGQAVGQPLTGHTDRIWSVIYLPSGEHIISGSRDRTIRIWNAFTGQPVGQALQGHTDEIRSLAYSPNGAYIISGSDDETIRIWDALTGYPVGQPLKGHTDLVWSVTYSHDGKHIISGSEDNTICIWDAKTGQPVGQPLQGHTSAVRSVACSPDGKFMASGSSDNTIRVWDLQTSQVIGESISLRTELPSASYSASATTNNERPRAHICCSACQIDGNHRPWTLNEDGWVVIDGDKLLVWVPPDLRGVLVRPQNTLVMSSKYGALYLDFDDCRMGKHWAEHFMPLKSLGLSTE